MTSQTWFSLLTSLFLQMIPNATSLFTLPMLIQQDLTQWNLDNHLLFNETKCVLLKFKIYMHMKSYLFLVRSCLLYCSHLWQPYLIQAILLLERFQRRATKVILMTSYISNYQIHLVKLKLLPLMCIYELSDILFF